VEHKGLTELNVHGCDLGDQGLIALGQVLRSNRTLTALNLDLNRFSLDELKGSVEKAAHQKELGRQAKMCAKVQLKRNQIAKVQARQAQMRSRPGYKQRPRRSRL
jgi:hypothetical protein